MISFFFFRNIRGKGETASPLAAFYFLSLSLFIPKNLGKLVDSLSNVSPCAEVPEIIIIHLLGPMFSEP